MCGEDLKKKIEKGILNTFSNELVNDVINLKGN